MGKRYGDFEGQRKITGQFPNLWKRSFRMYSRRAKVVDGKGSTAGFVAARGTKLGIPRAGLNNVTDLVHAWAGL